MKLQLDQIVHSDQSPYSIKKIKHLMGSMLHTGFDETKPILVRLRSRRRSTTVRSVLTSPRWEIYDGIHRYIALVNLQKYSIAAYSRIVPLGIPVQEI